jgi:hypothetical protein
MGVAAAEHPSILQLAIVQMLGLSGWIKVLLSKDRV